MQRIGNYIKAIIVCVLLSMLAAAITAFLMTGKFEVIAGGLLFGLFVLPSILVYYVLDYFHKGWKIKLAGYLIPLAGWFICLLVCMVMDALRQSSEGAGELAKLILISDLVAGIVVYIFISKTRWFK